MYIREHDIELPQLYFSHQRACFVRDGVILAHSSVTPALDSERVEDMRVRFRTIGDMTCTGATLSHAVTVDEIINEVAVARRAERGGRADDARSETAMEDRKRDGYF
jgi:sulfate adenylyltransferase subunit 2